MANDMLRISVTNGFVVTFALLFAVCGESGGIAVLLCALTHELAHAAAMLACGGKIRLHIGSALDIAPTLGGPFDLVFIDGDKREYPAYYRMLMGDDTGRPLVESGAFLLADNILWSGKVVAPVAHNDLHTQRILEFNRTVADDPRVENVIVPLRDGLNLIRVK